MNQREDFYDKDHMVPAQGSIIIQGKLESFPDIKAASQWWPRMGLSKISSGLKMAWNQFLKEVWSLKKAGNCICSFWVPRIPFKHLKGTSAHVLSQTLVYMLSYMWSCGFSSRLCHASPAQWSASSCIQLGLQGATGKMIQCFSHTIHLCSFIYFRFFGARFISFHVLTSVGDLLFVH